MPETEAILAIAPLPCRSICGSTCLQVRIDVADPVPALLASLDRTADFDGPDIVVQHVDPAKCRDLLCPEPLPKERFLHALAHFPTNSHISFTC